MTIVFYIALLVAGTCMATAGNDGEFRTKEGRCGATDQDCCRSQ